MITIAIPAWSFDGGGGTVDHHGKETQRAYDTRRDGAETCGGGGGTGHHFPQKQLDLTLDHTAAV